MKKLPELYRKMIQAINYKIIAGIAIGILIISLLPVCYLAMMDYANGDDFGFGAVTHQVWLNTESLWQMLMAACQQVKKFYLGWQGTWFSLLIFQFHPAVFYERAYVIVPFFALFLTIGSTSLLSYYCMVKKLKLPVSLFLITDAIVLFLSIQYIPRTTSGIFWFNGVAHYIVPHAMVLISIYLFFRFIDDKKWGAFIGGSILTVLLGGANYQAALLIAILIIAMMVCTRKQKYSLLLGIPFIGEIVGLFISVIAPGNKVRGGSEFSFTPVRAIETIWQSIVSGVSTVVQYIQEKPMVFIMLLLLAVFAWEIMSRNKIQFCFKYPLLFVLFMFGVYCAMFAPMIYAAVDVSGGPPNTVYMVFLITAAASIVYVVGWVNAALNRSEKGKNRRETWYHGDSFAAYIRTPILLACLILVFLNKSVIYKTSTAFYCIDFVASGKSEDYKEQMEERLSILTDKSQKDVIVPEMNSDQYPFMHMALMRDPSSWTNMVTAQFYEKDSIIAIPRTEYEILYQEEIVWPEQ